jgi:hypothetical protein
MSAGAVLQDADDAVGLRSVGIAADSLGDGIAGFTHRCGENAGGALFEVRELRMGVDVLIGFDQRRRFGVDERGNGLRRCCGC